MVQFPSVGGIESGLVQPSLLTLGEEVEPAGIFRPELREGISPEVLRHLKGHVAPESVDSSVQPETHTLLHLSPHLLGRVVEFRDVRPIIFNDRVAARIADVPIGRLLSDPRMIWRGVVGHPVDDDLEPKVVHRLHKMVEILKGSELRIDVAVVLDGVVGTKGSLAALLSDRIDRHQPDHIHAQLLELREFLLGCRECALSGRLSGVQLIDHSVPGPVRLFHGHLRLGSAGECHKSCQQN